MISPVLFDFNELPRNSLLHYMNLDETKPDIDMSLMFLNNVSKRIYLDVAASYSLEELRGNPRKKPVIVRELIKHFIKENQGKFKFLPDHYTQIKDELSLLIINYSYLNIIYKYVDTPMSAYYKWYNANKTIWDTINKACKNSERNNFIFVDTPLTMPGRSILNNFSNRIDLTMTRVFDSPDKLFILELWKWINPETRDKSIIASIEQDSLSKVNLVFTTGNNRSCMLNLAYINSWIKGMPNQTEFQSVTQLNPEQIQILLIKLILTLQSNVPEEVIEDEIIEDEAKPEVVDTDEEVEDEVEDEDEEVKPSTDKKPFVSSFTKNKDSFTPTDTKETNEDKIAILDKELEEEHLTFTKSIAAIDKDINLLESISKKQLINKGIMLDNFGNEVPDNYVTKKEITLEESTKAIFEDKPTNSILKEIADEHAEIGAISASEYKKILNDINNYQVMKDPYGSKETVVELSNIKPEELKFNKDKTLMPDNENVLDKTMLNSTLLSFDSDYITKVMKKDTLAMIGTLQKAGVVIKKHSVEIDHSVLGTYENHTLELKPINGVASTVRFRLPKINEDGTFLNGNNRYLMRKQRVDAPIRKISPTEVALTSYYNKSFVRLDTKKANNSTEWLVRQINKLSMEDNDFIKQVDPANVFNNEFKAPYIYNALSERYKSIRTKDYVFVFDNTERKNIVPDTTLLETLEENGRVVVGYNNKKEPVVVAKDGSFYLYKDSKDIPIGNIYSLLGLREQESPVDFTTVNIFSKQVPTIIVLGYLLGIRKLFKYLNVTYREVEGRGLLLLKNHEYVIKIGTTSYIFSRNEKIASMIISGLLEYEKELKKYTLDDFDNKDVYFNLLRLKGLGSVYVKEIEMLDSLFVDSITKGILEEMKKPVTYRGLIIEANKMLTEYHHPVSQDMNYMRIRGYERIPGAIYKELSAAIRQYNNKSFSARAKIDISPYHIWSSITKDPSIKLMEDTNPIQNLKEFEVTTYVGEGGRGKDSMTKKTRAYQKNDMGITSEATVDSSDVGINAYLTANPAFSSMRGMVDTNKKLNPSNMLSTSALLAPGATHDDAKRVCKIAPFISNYKMKTSLIARKSC